MAILAECPQCHKKQSIKNRICECSADLVKLKKASEARFWINYRFPGGKQRREAVGFSIEEAKDAEGKRRGQKRENRIFDMLPESKMTFFELAQWYLSRESVKNLASFDRTRQTLANFNQVFGNWVVNTLKPDDLENYQAKRTKEGLAPATVDMELRIAKTMVNKALDNDLVDGKTLKAFRCIKRMLRIGANARTRTLSIDEYLKLMEVSPARLKPVIIIAFNTGMRKGELWKLKWSHIDHPKKFIRLPADITREGKVKNIPMNRHVIEALRTVPRGIRVDDVFTHNGKPYSDKRAFNHPFKTACKKKGSSPVERIPTA